MSNQTPKRKAATISADGCTQAVKFVSPQTKALKRQKTASFKEVLASPYRTPWPPISAEDQETLLALLKSSFDGLKLKRTKLAGESAKSLRQQLCFGINEVTRGLEKDLVQLVVVCKDVQSLQLVQHIPIQCGYRNVAMACLSNTEGTSSFRLGSAFGLRTLIAFAVKKSGYGKHATLCNFVKRKVSIPVIPWSSSLSKSEIEKGNEARTTTAATPYYEISTKKRTKGSHLS